MDKISLETFKEIVEKLVSETSCPVCFNSLQSPVHLCSNGHGVCDKCRTELDECPLCMTPLSSNPYKHVLLNNILDVLPRKCRFEGCEVFVTQEDDHEKWCGYKPTTCYWCKWTDCGKDILNHIKKNHTNREINSGNNKGWRYTSVHLNKEIFDPLFFHGHFFWVKRSNPEDKIVAVDFIYVPNGKLKSSFTITMVLKNNKKTCSSSIYVTPENVWNKEETSMWFVYSRVQSLITSERDLCFFINVEKE